MNSLLLYLLFLVQRTSSSTIEKKQLLCWGNSCVHEIRLFIALELDKLNRSLPWLQMLLVDKRIFVKCINYNVCVQFRCFTIRFNWLKTFTLYCGLKTIYQYFDRDPSYLLRKKVLCRFMGKEVRYCRMSGGSLWEGGWGRGYKITSFI